MRIALHFGAHKTASTYIQDTLKASAARLEENGVAFVPLEQMRRTITLQVRKGGLRLRPMLRRQIEMHAECHSLILSDENMIGGPSELVNTGRFYPKLQERASRLVRNLKSEDIQVFISLRSYDTFLSSLYCEYIRHNPFLTSNEYLESVKGEISWLNVVGDLCDLVGEDRVTIWRYEDFREIEDQVFAALCGTWPIGLEKPSTAVWESLSGKAIEALAALRGVLSASEIQSLVPAMTSAFPKGARNGPFEMFERDNAYGWRERYGNDWEALERKFPRMTILRPSEAAVSTRHGSRLADWAQLAFGGR